MSNRLESMLPELLRTVLQYLDVPALCNLSDTNTYLRDRVKEYISFPLIAYHVFNSHYKITLNWYVRMGMIREIPTDAFKMEDGVLKVIVGYYHMEMGKKDKTMDHRDEMIWASFMNAKEHLQRNKVISYEWKNTCTVLDPYSLLKFRIEERSCCYCDHKRKIVCHVNKTGILPCHRCKKCSAISSKRCSFVLCGNCCKNKNPSVCIVSRHN